MGFQLSIPYFLLKDKLQNEINNMLTYQHLVDSAVYATHLEWQVLHFGC